MQTRDILRELRPNIPANGFFPPPADAASGAAFAENAWTEPASTPQSQSPQHRELKFALHRKLLDRIDLQAVSSLPPDLMRRSAARDCAVDRRGKDADQHGGAGDVDRGGPR